MRSSLHRATTANQKPTRSEADARYTKAIDGVGTGPTFVRTGQILFQASQSALGSIYWWSVQHVVGKIASPLANYYAWYSTDHSTGAGGVCLATAPTPLGPWTDRGQVYVDTTTGRTQTEDCVVEWDEVNLRFNLYYKAILNNVAMYTHLATSPDGVTWTYNSQIFNLTSTDNPGTANVLQGYLSPFRVGGMWGGYSLLAGGNYPCYMLAYSQDGATWQTDPRPLWHQAQYGDGGNTLRTSFEGSAPFLYRGRLYVVMRTSPFTSGVGGTGSSLVVAPLSENWRNVLGTPKAALSGAAHTSETTNIRSQRRFVDPVTGQVILYYITASTTDTPVSSGLLFAGIATS